MMKRMVCYMCVCMCTVPACMCVYKFCVTYCTVFCVLTEACTPLPYLTTTACSNINQPRLCCCSPSKLHIIHPLPVQRTPVPPAQSMRMMVSSIVRSISVCSPPVQRHCTPSQSWRSETAQSITGREIN